MERLVLALKKAERLVGKKIVVLLGPTKKEMGIWERNGNLGHEKELFDLVPACFYL